MLHHNHQCEVKDDGNMYRNKPAYGYINHCQFQSQVTCTMPSNWNLNVRVGVRTYEIQAIANLAYVELIKVLKIDLTKYMLVVNKSWSCKVVLLWSSRFKKEPLRELFSGQLTSRIKHETELKRVWFMVNSASLSFFMPSFSE